MYDYKTRLHVTIRNVGWNMTRTHMWCPCICIGMRIVLVVIVVVVLLHRYVHGWVHCKALTAL